MNDPFSQEYARFARERLRPAVTAIAARKRSGIVRGVAAGLVFFLLGGVVVYVLLAPYREIMKNNSAAFWPLLLLAPAALGILVFSLVSVLSLRKTVVDFRNALIGGMAEFIDSGLVYESDNPLSQDKVKASNLFSGDKKVMIGSERFRGRSGDASAEFADIRVENGGPARRGIFFAAHYERAFPHPFFIFPSGTEVSRSGLEEALERSGYAVSGGLVRVERGGRQFLVPAGEEETAGQILSRELLAKLDEVRAANGGELYLAGRDNDMFLALLSPSGDKENVGLFEGFDFDGCREFCRDAKLAMALARKGGERQGVTKHFLS